MRKIRTQDSYKRKKKYVRPNPFFIIVCEGKVTEADYFKSFPYYRRLGEFSRSGEKHSHPAVCVVPQAGQYEQVVEKADRKLRELEEEYGGTSPDEVWCVFDCDNNVTALKRAIQLSNSKDFNAIYSIQCFELWYLLHFQMLSTAIDKKEYDKKISKKLNIEYTHGSIGLYELLKPHQEDAIHRAERIWERKSEDNELLLDPITNVHLLVKALNQAYLKINGVK